MEMGLFSQLSVSEASAVITFCLINSLVSLERHARPKVGFANVELSPLQEDEAPTGR